MQPELKPVRTDDQASAAARATRPPRTSRLDAESQKVLRNTYLLLALTMVPTVIGACIGMATAGIIMASPIISSLVMLAAVIGLQFAIAANRNSGIGVALLLLMTGLLGWWLGPILNVALSMKNGMAAGRLRRGRHRRDLLRHGRARRRPSSAISASWASSCSSA